MRNLKKFLALVLAMMMVFSLMLTANAATDFVDDANISDDYRQAVEVLSGLGVLKGDEDGLRPGDPISRAEFAIILYRAATGDTEGTKPALNAMAAVDSPFTDVTPNNYGWAAKWINYAHSMGWLVGHGDGTFAPEEEVSVYQVMVAMLRVLGEGDGIGGDNWEFQAATKATEIGIADNIESFLGSASREVVGQLAFNTMTYSPSGGIMIYVVSEAGKENIPFDNSADAYFYAAAAVPAGSRTVTAVPLIKDTLFNTAFGGEMDYGVIVASPATNPNNAYYGTITLAGSYNSTYVGYAGLDLIGHYVEVYYFDNARGDHVVYALVDLATNVAAATLSSSNTLEVAARANGFRANTAAGADVGLNYVFDFYSGATTPIGSGDRVILISNSANYSVDCVIKLSRTVAVIDSVSSRTVDGEVIKTYVTKVNDGTNSNDTKSYVDTDIVTEDVLARGDVVHIMEMDVDNDTYSDLTYIEKAEVMTGVFYGTTVSGRGASATTYYNVGSGSYLLALSVYNATFGGTRFVANFAPEADNVGKVYNFVLNDFNRIAALIPVEEVNSRGYAYLAAFGQGPDVDSLGNQKTPALLALLYFPDGTSEIVELDTTSGTSKADNAFYGDTYSSAQTWKQTTDGVVAGSTSGNGSLVYSVTVNSDGTYLLTEPNTLIGGGATLVNPIKSNVVAGDSGANTAYYANAQSVTFTVSGAYEDASEGNKNTLKVGVIHGVEGLKGQTLNVGYGTSTGSINVYTVGVIQGFTPDLSNATIYYYTGSYRTVYDGTQWVTTYNVYLNGEATTVTWTGTKAPTADVYKAAGLARVGANGHLEGLLPSNAADGWVIEYYEGYLTVTDGSYIWQVLVDDADVYDISDQGFGAYDEAGRTVFVALTYSNNGSVDVAKQIYVYDVPSNDDELIVVRNRQFETANGNTVYVTITNTAALHEIKINESRAGGGEHLTLGQLASLLPDGAVLFYEASVNVLVDGVTGLDLYPAYRTMIVGTSTGVPENTDITTGAVVAVMAEDYVQVQVYTITIE